MGEYQLLYWKICLKYFLEKYRADCVRCSTRACLKIHSRHLHAPLCGIFGSHSVNVAHYASLIRVKSPTNCDAHLTESNFQTRSNLDKAVIHFAVISLKHSVNSALASAIVYYYG